MKKLGNLLCTAIALIAMTSCGAFKSYVADYSIGLKTVESPANAKQQFGDTKVVNFQDGTTNKYRYEDDYINIVWYVGSKQFNFDLTNKSGHTLKINWDDISYVDYKGQTGRVMHSGVKYNERNNSQPASTVPKGASLSDLLLPTGVTALIAKHLIISPKMGFFYCAKPLKMGEMWCVLVGLGAKISKFSANF